MKRHAVLGLVLAGMLIISEGAFGAGVNAQARVSLNRTLPAINFANVTMRDAIDFLRDLSGANIHVNWKAIEATGITADTTINMKLRQVTLQKVLSLLLSEASGGTGLTFYVDSGVIEVTTSDMADSQMITKVYAVEDLLFEPPDFVEPPDFDLSSNNGGGGRGNGRNVGNQQRTTGSPRTQTTPKDKNAKPTELVNLIIETIKPPIWVPNGGKATIKYFNGSLIITAPRSVHEAIGGPVD